MTFVRVCGKLDGHVVWATWEDGDLDGEPVLLETIRRHVRAAEAIPLLDGASLRASIDDAWAFTATVCALVDDPNVTGDDLPSVDVQRHSQSGGSDQPTTRAGFPATTA